MLHTEKNTKYIDLLSCQNDMSKEHVILACQDDSDHDKMACQYDMSIWHANMIVK